MSTPETRPLALVESPAQLLNAVEWAAVSDRPLDVVVIAPQGAHGRMQIHAVAELAGETIGSLRWVEARIGPASTIRALGSVLPAVQRAETLVIGDPFSRFLQTLLPFAASRRIVVVDDGTATIEFADLSSRGAPLVRWHRNRTGEADRLLAWQAGRRLRAADVQIFTAMPLRHERHRVQRNEYRWLAERFAAPEVTHGATLVGTSLVETGVIDADSYLRGVATLVAERGVRRYYAHRRETLAKLSAIAGLGVTVERPGLPLEIELARGPVTATVLSFPSTVLHTLPVVLQGAAVTVEAVSIDDAWLVGSDRRFLDTVGA